MGDGVRQQWRLHASPTGRFVAVVVDFGRIGVAVDVADEVTTMRLDRGWGHHETVPFGAGFAALGGRDVLVHQTAWNRPWI